MREIHDAGKGRTKPRYFDKTKPKSLRPLKVDCLNIRKIEKFLSNQTDSTNEGTYQRTFFWFTFHIAVR